MNGAANEKIDVKNPAIGYSELSQRHITIEAKSGKMSAISLQSFVRRYELFPSRCTKIYFIYICIINYYAYDMHVTVTIIAKMIK